MATWKSALPVSVTNWPVPTIKAIDPPPSRSAPSTTVIRVGWSVSPATMAYRPAVVMVVAARGVAILIVPPGGRSRTDRPISPRAAVAVILVSSRASTASSVCGASVMRVAPISMSASLRGSVQNVSPDVTG